MKHIRKIVALAIAVVLVAAVLIGLGVIFSVRNVNVTLLSYSCEQDSDDAQNKIAEFKGKILSEVRGTVMVFVHEDEVSAAIGDGDFVLESWEKVYPCTINVTVRERREVFAVSNGDETYSVYDETGLFLRRAETAEDAYNRVDKSPNLLIEGADNDEDIKRVADICSIFRSKFMSLRSVAEKVVLSKAQSQLERDGVTFYLRCGVSIEIFDCGVLTEEKIEAGYNEFTSLSGERKLGGKIYCYAVEGEVQANYTQNH